MKPIIAVTMGDASGIGPEIILKTFSEEGAVRQNLIVIGDLVILEKVKELLGYRNIVLNPVRTIDEVNRNPAKMNIWDMKILNLKDIIPGTVSPKAGDAAFCYIREAIQLAGEGKVAAVVTAPVCKEAIQLAGHKFAGHTEIFAHFTGAENYAMLLYDPKFSVIHISTHIPIADAISGLNQNRVESVIQLGEDLMRKILGYPPKIAVAGLNPHAGENGLFGTQEVQILKPAIENMRLKGISVSGPYAPDTVFLRAFKGEFDLVVAMYHDQGHIPVKLLGFESGVNVTAGLPIIRTSVDHGTAFDIAWKGIAGNESLLNAIDLAKRLAQ